MRRLQVLSVLFGLLGSAGVSFGQDEGVFPFPPRPGEVRILTWNIERLGSRDPLRTPQQLDAIADRIRTFGASVLALQEVAATPGGIDGGSKPALDAILRRLGPNWRASFGDGPNGFVYDTNRVQFLGGESLNALRFPPYSSFYTDFPNWMEDFGPTGAPFRDTRGLPETALFRQQDRVFRVISHHFPFGGQNEFIREYEGTALNTYVAELLNSPAETPLVYLAGDFNAQPNRPPHGQLRADGVLEMLPKENTDNTTALPGTSANLDHIYATQDGATSIPSTTAFVIRPSHYGETPQQFEATFSDHTPVFVDVGQRPPPPNGVLPPVPVPPENPITEEKRVLGKILFWDEQLSSDTTMACGTCHIPSFAGADPNFGTNPGHDGFFGTDDDVIGSPGVVRRNNDGVAIEDPIFGFGRQVTGRAAPSYFASMFAPDLFWDGRASNSFVDPVNGRTMIARGGALESQAIGPIMSSGEMAKDGRTWSDVAERLRSSTPLALATNIPQDVAEVLASQPSYSDLFTNAFGDPAVTPTRIAFAIATYERTLVADQTPWDRFMAGETTALTTQQREGWDLLVERTVCLNCHQPPLFTDNNFHNIGLRPSLEDPGRMDVTGDRRDIGRFKTPSLRNVGLKASLMHVGWVTDVKDAIDFYNSGQLTNTGHMQFTQDQSGIPTNGRGPNRNIGDILMPVITQGGLPFQALVIDFLENGLTDPRVANERFPFDRPTLKSERSGGDGEPILRVTPASIDFSTVPIGASASRIVEVSNIGQGLLRGSIVAPIPFSTIGPSNYAIAAGDSRVITITFTPQVAGSVSDAVDFLGDQQTFVLVSGVGLDLGSEGEGEGEGEGEDEGPILPASISVDVSSVDFGDVAVASFTTRVIEVTNMGDEMLVGTASTRPPFRVIHGGDYSIAGGASVLVYVRFTPLRHGDYSGAVTFKGGGGISVELVAKSMASGEDGNEGEEEGENEGPMPDLCSMRDSIQSGYAALAAALELPDADHDFDGLPDDFALALVCAVCDREAGDDLRGATLNAFDINREALANEESYRRIEPHEPVLAALMLISRDMRDALRGTLSQSDVQLSGIYESVAALESEYRPSSVVGKPLSEAYLVFEIEPKGEDEPYAASGDFDLDGASNLSEFTQANISGDTTIGNFIDAATDPLSAGSQEGEEESELGCAAATGGSGLGAWGDAAMIVGTIGLLLLRGITRGRRHS